MTHFTESSLPLNHLTTQDIPRYPEWLCVTDEGGFWYLSQTPTHLRLVTFYPNRKEYPLSFFTAPNTQNLQTVLSGPAEITHHGTLKAPDTSREALEDMRSGVLLDFDSFLINYLNSLKS